MMYENAYVLHRFLSFVILKANAQRAKISDWCGDTFKSNRVNQSNGRI